MGNRKEGGVSRINEKIGAWLVAEGNTMGKLADDLGITRQTLRSKLYGETDWTWSQVVSIAKITETSLDELAGFPNGNPDQV